MHRDTQVGYGCTCAAYPHNGKQATRRSDTFLHSTVPQLPLEWRKHQIQPSHIHREMILRLRQNPLPVLCRRKFNIEFEQNPRRQRANLHVS
jgi:hypothetical protein